MCCESCWQARAQSAGMIERIRIQPLDVRIVAVVGIGRRRFWRLLSKPYGYSQKNSSNVGTIVEIKGVVLDAVFPDRCPRSTARSASPPTAAS